MAKYPTFSIILYQLFLREHSLVHENFSDKYYKEVKGFYQEYIVGKWKQNKDMQSLHNPPPTPAFK